MLDMAGVSIPKTMQGLTLKPLITGKQKIPMAIGIPRKELYYHYYEYPVDHSVLPHLGIREKRYKLIYFYTVNEWEFYDLKNDPSEKTNQISVTKYKAEIERMKKRLKEVRKEYKDDEPAGELK
jgi:arylsulfatase A-like enzyme